MLSVFEDEWVRTIITVLLSVFLTHKLSDSREWKKRKKDLLTDFYYKVIPRIYDLFSIETSFMKHDLKDSAKPSQLKEEILNLIESNTSYLTPKVFDAYRKVRLQKYYDDDSGFYHDVEVIDLFVELVREYLALRKHRSVKKNIQNDLKYENLLLIWKNAILYCGGMERAYSAISRHFYFDSEKLDKGLKRKLTHLEKLEQGSDAHQNYFREILQKLLTKEEKPEREELIAAFLGEGPEENDSLAINIMMNPETILDLCTISSRRMLRNSLIEKYYKDKYSGEFPYTPYEKVCYQGVSMEYHNAIKFLEEKGFIKVEETEENVILRLTHLGDEYYENYMG